MGLGERFISRQLLGPWTETVTCEGCSIGITVTCKFCLASLREFHVCCWRVDFSAFQTERSLFEKIGTEFFGLYDDITKRISQLGSLDH